MSSLAQVNRFGGTQADYLERKEMIVQEGCQKVKEGRESGANLEQLFFSLIDFLSKERNQMAIAQGTPDSNFFGRKRTSSAFDVNYTCLAGNDGYGEYYEPYNKRMLAFLQEIIKGAIPIKGEPTKKKIGIEETHLGRNCSFEVEVLTPKDLSERQWDKEVHSEFFNDVSGLKQNPEYLKIDQIDFADLENKKNSKLIKELNENQLTLKKINPKVYEHGKMSFVLKGLNHTFPSPQILRYPDGSHSFLGNSSYLKNIFLLGKVRLEIEGKMYALTQYLTWTYQDHKNDPAERLKRSAIVLIHEDKYLIDDTLKEISRLFKKVLAWEKTKNEIKELKEQVSLIRYLFSHTMPYMRRSAAIGDWFEEIIYRDRGFIFNQVEGKSVDLESFIAPTWSTFSKNYESIIELT